ncbi:hypothetical protein B0J11DRAFT_589450 [Dendryphion nanum]|uniref:NAD-dependent epimerase/dehydratase domain-containing protein n=1 Tax=Dendryphion nanum TaxID=256645 RepID=A0A9P9EM83_9PLEO|nr:hypothetical protein B0J11DRAFT_589450 [Dendryphion nanum]
MASRTGTVLLTGANGFVASHILSLLVAHNYHTVATVRSEKKGQQIIKLYPTWEPFVTFAIVSDITSPGAYDEIFKAHKFDYIIHNASPINFAAQDIEKDLVQPAIQGTTTLLSAAHTLGTPTLRRFVLLGSAVAVLNSLDPVDKPGKPYDESDWNPITPAIAISNSSIVEGYTASKTLAERAAWDFLSSEKPGFDLVVINPDVIIGPLLQPLSGPESVNDTNAFFVYNFINGTFKDVESIRFPFYHFVDVREVARAHLLALTSPLASNLRIIIVSGLITPQLVADSIRTQFPDLRDRVPEGKPGNVLPEGVDPTGWDNRRSFEVFGKEWRYRELGESVKDTVESLVRWERVWGG